MPVKLWYEKMRAEQSAWLVQKLLEGKQTPYEIVELFHIRFPKAESIQFTEQELIIWASENLPGWTASTGESVNEFSLEEEVEKETKGIISESNFLDGTDDEKVNAIKKHRRLLLEAWDNYWRLKDGDSPNENAKKGWIDTVREELKIISDLESKEKSLLSILDEVIQAEEAESAEDFRDYVEGYCLQKIAQKLKTNDKIKEQFNILKNNIDLFIKKIEEAPNLEEGIRRYLQKIYA